MKLRRALWLLAAAAAAPVAVAVAATAPDPNAVLDLVRGAVDDLQVARREDAAAKLDSALAMVEATHGAGPEAARARSLWYEEGCKVFKGEPYERSMMYYYRGLLYLWKSDFGNARACFGNGILQDAFAEEAQYRCDFGLLYFLSVYAARQAGQKAESDEQDLLRLRPDSPRIQGNLVLLICETGKAPRKLADGVGHYELKLRRGKNFRSVRAQVVCVDGQTIPAYPMEDIAFQAMTRGGRPVDAIIAGKVQFQETTSAIGTSLTAASSLVLQSSTAFAHSTGTLQGVGGAVGVAGVLFDFAAAKTKPHADVRTWDNLPDTVHVALLAPETVRAGFTVQFLDAGGQLVAAAPMGGPGREDSNLLWCRNSD